MKVLHLLLILSAFLLLNIAYAAEPAYITDSLQLRLFAEANENSEVIQTMQSGESVEILETKGSFSHVRTYDNTIGWLKSAFLVSETPPTLLYYAVSEENKDLKQQLEQLKNKSNNFGEAGSNQDEINKISELQQTLNLQREENKQLKEKLVSIHETESILPTNEATQKTTTFNKVAYATSFLTFEKVLYLLAALLMFLLFGIILGSRSASRRMRKRLHGYTLE